MASNETLLAGAAALKEPTCRLVFSQTNPKRKGSAAWIRYEDYKKKTTVAAAIKAGALKGDLTFDFEKGHLHIPDAARPVLSSNSGRSGGHLAAPASVPVQPHGDSTSLTGGSSSSTAPPEAVQAAPAKKRYAAQEETPQAPPVKKRCGPQGPGAEDGDGQHVGTKAVLLNSPKQPGGGLLAMRPQQLETLAQRLSARGRLPVPGAPNAARQLQSASQSPCLRSTLTTAAASSLPLPISAPITSSSSAAPVQAAAPALTSSMLPEVVMAAARSASIVPELCRLKSPPVSASPPRLPHGGSDEKPGQARPCSLTEIVPDLWANSEDLSRQSNAWCWESLPGGQPSSLRNFGLRPPSNQSCCVLGDSKTPPSRMTRDLPDFPDAPAPASDACPVAAWLEPGGFISDGDLAAILGAAMMSSPSAASCAPTYSEEATSSEPDVLEINQDPGIPWHQPNAHAETNAGDLQNHRGALDLNVVFGELWQEPEVTKDDAAYHEAGGLGHLEAEKGIAKTEDEADDDSNKPVMLDSECGSDTETITLFFRLGELSAVKLELEEEEEAAKHDAEGRAMPVAEPDHGAESQEARVQFEAAQTLSYESNIVEKQNRKEHEMDLLQQGYMEPLETLDKDLIERIMCDHWDWLFENRFLLFKFLKLGTSASKWYGDAAEAFFKIKRQALISLLQPNEAATEPVPSNEDLTLFLNTEMDVIQGQLFAMPEKGRFAPKIFAADSFPGCMELD